MTIVSITGADIAQAFGSSQHILWARMRYEQGGIHGNSLSPAASEGDLLVWVVAPLPYGLTVCDFYWILTYIAGLFPNKKIVWAYEEVEDKRQTEIILLTTS